MEASKALRKALKAIDMDLACGVYERLQIKDREALTRASVAFFYEYTNILKYGLGYTRSGDKYGWRDKWAYCLGGVYRLLFGKDKEGERRGEAERKAGRQRIYKAANGYNRSPERREQAVGGKDGGQRKADEREGGEAGG